MLGSGVQGVQLVMYMCKSIPDHAIKSYAMDLFQAAVGRCMDVTAFLQYTGSNPCVSENHYLSVRHI
jgi:hypothetical protein